MLLLLGWSGHVWMKSASISHIKTIHRLWRVVIALATRPSSIELISKVGYTAEYVIQAPSATDRRASLMRWLVAIRIEGTHRICVV